MGLYPPFGWSQRIGELYLPSGWGLRMLEPPSSCSWRIWNFVLPMNEFLIYIRKHSMVFSHLGFHVNIDVLCSL
jgi:hypothetical protein